jgi:AcrR family transcriptional regulator
MKRATIQKSKRGRPVDPTLPQRRREEILAAATHFFARHGYLNADIELLAQDLEVGKGTIYRYFRNKEQLFKQALLRGLHDLHRSVTESTDAADDGVAKMRNAVLAYFKYFDQHPELIELIVLERAELKGQGKPTYFAHREQYLDPWRKRLLQLMASGDIRRMNVDTLISTLGMLMYGALVTHPYMGGKSGLSAHAPGVMDLFINGIVIRPEKGGSTP